MSKDSKRKQEKEARTRKHESKQSEAGTAANKRVGIYGGSAGYTKVPKQNFQNMTRDISSSGVCIRVLYYNR